MQETQVQVLGEKDPLKKEMATHSVFLPGESQGQRSLVGYSPRDRKSRTQRLNHQYDDNSHIYLSSPDLSWATSIDLQDTGSFGYYLLCQELC